MVCPACQAEKREGAKFCNDCGTAGAERPDHEHLHERLGLLHVLRGDLDAARESLRAMRAWDDTGNVELLCAYRLLDAAIALAAGDAARAHDLAAEVLRDSIVPGAGNENSRAAWPVAFDAALAAERLDEAGELIALLSSQAPGLTPPYMRTHLARSRGLLAAARGDHDEVEADLEAAIAGFRALGPPYWTARTQADLAAWLLRAGRTAEAKPVLDEAIATLEGLRAAPDLTRVLELRAVLAERVTA